MCGRDRFTTQSSDLDKGNERVESEKKEREKRKERV